MSENEQEPAPLPLISGRRDKGRTPSSRSEPPPLPVVSSGQNRGSTEPARSGTPQAAAATRTVGPAVVGGIVVYLCRQLGPASFGLYALTLAIGAAGLYTGWVVLPRVVPNLATLPGSKRNRVRVRLGVPFASTATVAVTLFVLAGPVARGYGNAALGWPLRWTALAIVGQGLVWRLRRRIAPSSVWGVQINIARRLVEAAVVITLVSSGAGLSGAVLGGLAGYVVAVAGIGLVVRGQSRLPRGRAAERASNHQIADSDLAADATASWAVVLGVGVIVAAAIVAAAPLGRFSAALGLAVTLSYASRELAGIPTSSVQTAWPRIDTPIVAPRLRFVVLLPGVVLAPMLVWAHPVMHLLFGDRYGAGAGALRLLAVTVIAGALASLASAVSRTFERNWEWLLPTNLSIEVGAVVTYILATVGGIVGAAAGVDVLMALYLLGHFWLGRTEVASELPALSHSIVRTLAAAIAMAAVLFASGTRDLTVTGWVGGTIGGTAAYLAVLLATGEISVAGLLRSAISGGDGRGTVTAPTEVPRSL